MSNNRRSGHFACLGSCLLLLTSGAFAAGFDCEKAASHVERLICDSQELSALDDELTSSYLQLESYLEGAELEKLATEQSGWQAERSRCESVVCVTNQTVSRKTVLDSRIAELDALAEVESDYQEMIDSGAEAEIAPETSAGADTHSPTAPSADSRESAGPPAPAEESAPAASADAGTSNNNSTSPPKATVSPAWGYVMVAFFLGGWIGSAWFLKRNGKSNTISYGGGLLAGVVLLVAVAVVMSVTTGVDISSNGRGSVAGKWMNDSAAISSAEQIVQKSMVDPDSYRRRNAEIVWRGTTKSKKSAYAVQLDFSGTNAFGGRIQGCQTVLFALEGDQITWLPGDHNLPCESGTLLKRGDREAIDFLTERLMQQ
jgi:uncharacterized protein